MTPVERACPKVHLATAWRNAAAEVWGERERTFGHEFRLALNLWKARPAFSMGLSIRPPPATMPIAARAFDVSVFFWPDGMRTRTLLAPSM